MIWKGPNACGKDQMRVKEFVRYGCAELAGTGFASGKVQVECVASALVKVYALVRQLALAAVRMHRTLTKG
jgi:hypothetical protein